MYSLRIYRFLGANSTALGSTSTSEVNSALYVSVYVFVRGIYVRICAMRACACVRERVRKKALGVRKRGDIAGSLILQATAVRKKNWEKI